VRKADNPTTVMCRLSRNCGSFNLLDTKEPIQACKVIALPFICNWLKNDSLCTNLLHTQEFTGFSSESFRESVSIYCQMIGGEAK
jgi:hypothetical protein